MKHRSWLKISAKNLVYIPLLCMLQLYAIQISAQYQVHPALKMQAYLENNQTDSALSILSQLIESKQNSEKWLIFRGQLYLKNGQTNEAIADFMQVDRKRPGMTTFLLAKAYAQQYDTVHALYYLEKNLNSSYKISKNSIWQEKSFHFLQNTDKWKKLWEKEWYTKYDYYEGEMRYLYESRDWTGVINMMADIGKDSKRLSAHAFYMAAIAYFQLENYNAALTNFSIALSKSKREAMYYAGRGDCYMRMKNYSKAIADYTLSIQFSPETLKYHLLYIQALMGLKNYDLAYEEALSISQVFPSNQDILFTLAQAAYQTNRYINALATVNQLLSAAPDDTAYLHLRARCYTKTGMFDQALKDYERLLEKFPQQHVYRLERGNIYFQMNDKARACNDWKYSANNGNITASQLLWEHCSK